MEAKIDQWHALEVMLAENRDLPIKEALSEIDLVALVLEFVNAPTLAGYVRLLARDALPGLNFRPQQEALTEMYGPLMTVERAQRIADDAVAESVEVDRQQARADLGALVEGCLSLKMVTRLTESASRQVLMPVFDLEKNRLRVRYRYRASGLGPILDHAVLLLAGNSDGSELCRCKLQSCGRFFLANRKTGGRPRTDFCQRAHMHQAHDEAGVQRAEKSRKLRAERRRVRPSPKRREG